MFAGGQFVEATSEVDGWHFYGTVHGRFSAGMRWSLWRDLVSHMVPWDLLQDVDHTWWLILIHPHAMAMDAWWPGPWETFSWSKYEAELVHSIVRQISTCVMNDLHLGVLIIDTHLTGLSDAFAPPILSLGFPLGRHLTWALSRLWWCRHPCPLLELVASRVQQRISTGPAAYLRVQLQSTCHRSTSNKIQNTSCWAWFAARFMTFFFWMRKHGRRAAIWFMLIHVQQDYHDVFVGRNCEPINLIGPSFPKYVVDLTSLNEQSYINRCVLLSPRWQEVVGIQHDWGQQRLIFLIMAVTNIWANQHWHHTPLISHDFPSVDMTIVLDGWGCNHG